MKRGSTIVTPMMKDGLQAFCLENATIRVIVVPELGAKLVSLLYKPTEKEWLIDSSTRRLGRVQYGSTFTEADMSGWDECFPTIDACAYPLDGAYAGRRLPDHGEVWSLSWDATVLGETLVCTVNGMALPYRMSRALELVGEDELRMVYSVTNTGNETIAVMWTAHPQFVATADTEIHLAQGVDRVLCVHGGKKLMQGYTYEWPEAVDHDGSKLRIDRVGPAEHRDARKFYVDGILTSGWARLINTRNREFLSMSWSPDQMPFLGIWIDEGAFNDRSVCALEPSTGYYDNLCEVDKSGTARHIEPGAVDTWELTVRLGCLDRRLSLSR